MANEKIEDILLKMNDKSAGTYFTFTEWEIKATPKVRHLLASFANEIEAAIKAEREKYERSYQSLEAHCRKLENEYLLATNALKPVLDHDDRQYGFSRNQPSIVVAVREAKMIWGRRDSSENARGLDGEVGR